MADDQKTQTPMSHWLIAGAGLIWNLFGFQVYLTQVSATPEELARVYSEAEIEFLSNVPAWATSANAIAVTAGVVACVLLLFRKSLALPFLLVSLAAIIAQDVYSFVLNDVVAIFGMVPVYIHIVVLAVAIALIFYARWAKGRGLLS